MLNPSLCLYHSIFILFAVPLKMPLLIALSTLGTPWFGFASPKYELGFIVTFFFIHRLSSSFDTQDNPWCLRPTRWLLTRLFAEKNTPSRHQTSRFLFHRNCAPSSWDHLRSLVDWTIEPAPWSRHRNWSQQNPTSSSACWIHWDAQWRFCCPLSSG